MAEYERQQRERRERDDAEALARHSRRMGQMGAIPPLGGSIDGHEYQKGLREYQAQQRAKEAKEKSRWPVVPSRQAADWPVNTASSPRRSRRLVGGVTTWFIHHAWPFSALHDWGEGLRESGRTARLIMAILGGLVGFAMLSLPALHDHFAQELLSSPGPIYAAAFFVGTFIGWLVPTILGLVLVGSVRLTAVAVEIGIYAAVVWLIIQAVNAVH